MLRLACDSVLASEMQGRSAGAEGLGVGGFQKKLFSWFFLRIEQLRFNFFLPAFVCSCKDRMLRAVAGILCARGKQRYSQNRRASLEPWNHSAGLTWNCLSQNSSYEINVHLLFKLLLVGHSITCIQIILTDKTWLHKRGFCLFSCQAPTSYLVWKPWRNMILVSGHPLLFTIKYFSASRYESPLSLISHCLLCASIFPSPFLQDFSESGILTWSLYANMGHHNLLPGYPGFGWNLDYTFCCYNLSVACLSIG